MHIMVVEALLIAIYLGDELLLIDIRNPFRSSTCLVRYSWSLVQLVYTSCKPANRHRNAAYSQHYQEYEIQGM